MRGARPARGATRAGRRRRQRQRHACGRAPLWRGDLDRLCGVAARVRPGALASRRPFDPVLGGRRREPALPGRVVRRGDVHVRGDVHPGPGEGGGRTLARVPARREDRTRELDARGLHRAAVQDNRQVHRPRLASNRRRCGAPGPGWRSSSAKPRRTSARRAASSPFATGRPSTSSRSFVPITAR